MRQKRQSDAGDGDASPGSSVPAQAGAHRAMIDAGGDRILYLYGVVASGRTVRPVDGAALEVVASSSLVAVVEAVSRDEFSPEALEDRLRCIDWVAPLARKHTAVLEAIMQREPVIPARLCTLFSSASAVADALAHSAQRFHDALRLIQGRQEWSCKLFCDEARLRAVIGAGDPGVRALDDAARTASQGQAYVLRKQRDARLAEVAAARVDAVVDDVVDTLVDTLAEAGVLARDPEFAGVRLRELLPEAATGRPEPMALNAALLVDVDRTGALRASIDALRARLAGEGFALELTGPWPPYSFCDGELDSSAGEDA